MNNIIEVKKYNCTLSEIQYILDYLEIGMIESRTNFLRISWSKRIVNNRIVSTISWIIETTCSTIESEAISFEYFIEDT